MIDETRIQKALAFILSACGLAIVWLAIGESLAHLLCDIFNLGVHPIQNTGRMSGVVATITVIVSAHGGAKVGGKWIDYKRERDCALPRDLAKEGGRENDQDTT